MYSSEFMAEMESDPDLMTAVAGLTVRLVQDDDTNGLVEALVGLIDVRIAMFAEMAAGRFESMMKSAGGDDGA